MSLDAAAYLKIITMATTASMDAVAIVNSSCQIIYANSIMKSFLKLRPKHLANKSIFCDLILFSICKGGCQIEQAIKSGEQMRFDESPSVLGKTKLRLMLNVTPIPPLGKPPSGAPASLGAIITIRDTTAELIMQAKYHKFGDILQERDDLITRLKERVKSLSRAMATR